MAYLKLSTLEYPFFEGDVRLVHPEITEAQTGDTFPCPDEFVKVVEVAPPTIDITKNQYFVEEAPQQIDGVWTQVFSVQVYTAEQLAWIAEQEKERQAKLDALKPKRPPQDLTKSGSAPNVIG